MTDLERTNRMLVNSGGLAMPPTPLIQPNADTCGQTCVAMAAGITVKEAIELCGFDGRTSSIKIMQMLQECGFASKLKPSRYSKMPQRAICRINYRNGRGGWRKRSHWVLLWDGKIYDPLGPEMTAVIGIGKRKKGKG